MQYISSFYLKSRDECTLEMTFGGNKEYFGESFDPSTRCGISTTILDPVLILGDKKKVNSTRITLCSRV